jgi:acyl carrier protein phosphodiesterase
MNFLAHCFLSCDVEERLVGNFLADYIGNSPLDAYPAGVEEGVILHRKIDAYTDSHPEVLKGVRRMYADHRKYAPVVVDILYDYILTYNWSRYSDQPLVEFTKNTYVSLEKYLPYMPARLQRSLPLMIADNWLMNYGTKEGLRFTFGKLQQRVSKPAHLAGAVDSLERDFELLNQEFNLFFPDVIHYVNKECVC